MQMYSIKECANVLKKDPNKCFSEDAIRKMIKENRLPTGVSSKKMGWQYIITAESDEDLISKFTKKFQRVNFVAKKDRVVETTEA